MLINCRDPEGEEKHVHTDFFAVRPEVFNIESMPKKILSTGAEMTFTTWIKDTVLNHEPTNYEWVPGSDPKRHSACRAGEGREYFETPVIHEHHLHPDICSVPETDRRYVRKTFVRYPWPKNWIRPSTLA